MEINRNKPENDKKLKKMDLLGADGREIDLSG